MANQPNPENVQRAIRVQRELDAKVLKRFRAEGDTVKDAYIFALMFATRKVELTADEYRKIADETEKARRGGKGGALMSILDLTPESVPAELRIKVEHVMRRNRLSWRQTLKFLALEVVSPSFARGVVSPATRRRAGKGVQG